MKPKLPRLNPLGIWLNRLSVRPITYLVMGLGLLLLDIVTGPFILFPITFVIPVGLSAWFCSVRLAYALAILLPVGRLDIALFLDHPSPVIYIVINFLIRIVVLLILAYFVGRSARQTRQLQEQVSNLMKICAWTRTVEYQGQWLSFEEYVKRRFGIETTHGISPDAKKRLIEQNENPDISPPEPN